jgi:glucose-6-phosphate 1-dehydrogenase
LLVTSASGSGDNAGMQLIPDNHVLVIFGANGDLSRRKLLPALYHLDAEGLMPEDYRVIGNSRSELSSDEFRSFARDGVERFGRGEIEADSWQRFSERLSYVSHDFTPENTSPIREALADAEKAVGGKPRRLYYLSVPPAAFPTIIEGLGRDGLSDRARVIVEKPFGSDRESFRQLSRVVAQVLEENDVYRIDHFLGKETVQNILALRFANGIFEPVWNRNHIDHVQIDVPETLGIENRGSFYEQTGALRDMFVTHLLQVLAFVAMEPPTSLEARPLKDETLKVFETIMPLEPSDVVRGQYHGYRSEPGVAEDSHTETFVAVRVRVANWRWAGVPFYLRTGKRLAEERQTVTLVFREPPRQMFRDAPGTWMDQDTLSLELGSDEGISVSFLAKLPGPTIELAPATMRFRYEGSFGSELIEAYERLLHDALLGDRTLFTRGDGIDRTWEIVDEVLENPGPLEVYEPGSWGPAAAADLIAPHRWCLP